MNIYQKLKPEAHLSKNGFDLSYRNVFSSKVGQILPVMCKEVVPGDHFEMNVSALTRTQTLNTAAFARMKQYFHFFFVSYQSLWHNWDSFISQRNNVESSYHNDSKFVPTVDLKKLKTRICEMARTPLSDARKFPKGLMFDIHGLPASSDRARLLDLLGYGYTPLYKTRVVPTTDNAVNFGSRRPLVDTDPKTVPDLTSIAEYYPNIFPILAYNKIYYDYYANPFYEENDPAKYNVDDISCNSMATSRVDVDRVIEMLTMKYRDYKKDYFTGLLPDTQFGSVSTVGLTPSVLQLTDGRTTGSVSSLNSNLQFYGPPSVANNKPLTVTNGVSILDLRKAQALQRWKETTLRAGFRHNDQALAHFGVQPRDFRDNHARYIGGIDEPINIQEITSNSETEHVQLGDIAGKGVSATSGQSVQFDATEFGVIMCCYSCIPEADYNSDVLKRNLSFTQPFDFFTPEFENLGFEAVYGYELSQYNRPESHNVLGYAPRYSYYKTSYDEIHGEFQSGGTLSAWTTPRIDFVSSALSRGLTTRFLKVDPRVMDSIFAMMQPQNQDEKKGITLKDYCTESYDQLLLNCYFDIKAVRPMSVIGLPSI